MWFLILTYTVAMTVSQRKRLLIVLALITATTALVATLIFVSTQGPDEEALVVVEEGVLVPEPKVEPVVDILSVEKVLFEYVEIKDSCDVHFEGECVIVRDEPSINGGVVTHLRNHVILKVDSRVENEGRTWYKITFDEHLSYPERVVGDWYIAAEYVDILLDEGEKTIWEEGVSTTSSKLIMVDRSKQRLYAYEGEEMFVEMTISTGLELSPTPVGTFTVFKKMPSRYMQGPLPGFSDYYDLPGVPWNLYFTEGGAVIHGAYWHNSFGLRYSHGCVNLLPEDARLLYEWADLGTKVTVK